MEANPGVTDPNNLHGGPYAVVTWKGKTTSFPLLGNTAPWK